MNNLLRFIAFVLMVGSAHAQSNLPACVRKDTAKWNNCFGIEFYPSGTKYIGDFINGKPHGQGTFYASNGTISEGIWAEGNLVRSAPIQQASTVNQTVTVASTQPNAALSNLPACLGRRSAIKDNCVGSTTYANGEWYVGEFVNDQRNGQGSLTLVNGDKYVGKFKDDKIHGLGTLFAKDGSVRLQMV